MVLKRIRAAFRTNFVQVGSVFLLTLATLVSILPLFSSTWAYIYAGVFWPVAAYVMNLIDPMPAPDSYDKY